MGESIAKIIDSLTNSFIKLYKLNTRQVVERTGYAFVILAFISLLPMLWIENLNAAARGESILFRIPVVIALAFIFLACIAGIRFMSNRWFQ